MKENKKRNKYLHKKQNKIEDENMDNNSDTPYKEPDYTKWYDELPKIPSEYPENKESEIVGLKTEAEMILKREEEFFSKKSGRNGHTDKSWLKTVLAKGTASDKVAAYVVTIQDSPVYNLPALRHLVSMVKVAKKKECLIVMETLTELFLSDLLRPNRKLVKFDQQPLSLLQELTSGNAVTRRKFLCHWLFEDHLKSLYLQFVNALDAVSKDTVDAHREKAVTAMYKLLSSNPEQESVLLKNLVNKLGDPNQKVVSKVIYSLTQLLRVHPVMKQVVANEIERFLFRSNIGSRAQYYAICFLSQYLFTKDDTQLAENLITIYFAFFKASIKKGDVDSRMMGALLMGVNRAYPYAQMERSELSEHVDTMYRLVHVTSFNISLQTLCLLYQIVGHSTDRFYCALYKKLLDPHLFSSAHQAMFINLVFKALRKDSNIDRVRVFIKRLLQVCLNAPSQLACALLYLVSELVAKRSALLAVRSHRQTVYSGADADADAADDGEERYTDAPLDHEDEVIKDSTNNEEEEDVKPDISELKSEPGWFHCKNTVTKVKSEVFVGSVRNPAHAGGEFAAYEELTALATHFHPTVALFARNILDKQQIKYSGDPLQDFTPLRFLERFVFKNPKQLSGASAGGEKGPDRCLALRKHYVASGAKSVAITSSAYTSQGEKNIPVDELFLYRYLKQRRPTPASEKIKKEDDSDVESVASEEFDELLDSMVGKIGDELDFADDVGDKLKSSKKGKRQQDSESESDEEFSDDKAEDVDEDEDMTDLEDGSEEEGNEEDSDAEAIDFGEDEPDFDDDIDLDNLSEDEDYEDETPSKSKQIKQSKVKDVHSLFAPAEKFAEMLEEAGSSKMKVGTAHDVSNKDNAALKQLQWESKRNWALNGKRKQSKGKPFHKVKRKKH